MRVNSFKYILFIVALVCVAGLSRGQQAAAGARLDSNSILIGQQVDLKLELNVPAGTFVSWPLFADSLAPSVEVVGTSPVDTAWSADKSKATFSQKLRITSFDTGYHVIPQIPFFQRTGKGDTMGLLAATEQLLLRVNTVPVDTTKAIKDIKGVMGAPLTFREILPWLLLGLLALGLLAGGWYYFYRLRQNKPVRILPPRPALPPHVIALEELEKLRQAKLWQAGQVKQYHSELTEIVRRYIEDRYHIMALEMTTDEILEAIRPLEMTMTAREDLRGMLTLADLVKFAKESPLPTQHDLSMRQAVDFVSLTRSAAEPDKVTDAPDAGTPGVPAPSGEATLTTGTNGKEESL